MAIPPPLSDRPSCTAARTAGRTTARITHTAARTAGRTIARITHIAARITHIAACTTRIAACATVLTRHGGREMPTLDYTARRRIAAGSSRLLARVQCCRVAVGSSRHSAD